MCSNKAYLLLLVVTCYVSAENNEEDMYMRSETIYETVDILMPIPSLYSSKNARLSFTPAVDSSPSLLLPAIETSSTIQQEMSSFLLVSYFDMFTANSSLIQEHIRSTIQPSDTATSEVTTSQTSSESNTKLMPLSTSQSTRNTPVLSAITQLISSSDVITVVQPTSVLPSVRPAAIIVTLEARTNVEIRISTEQAEMIGNDIRDQISEEINVNKTRITKVYLIYIDGNNTRNIVKTVDFTRQRQKRQQEVLVINAFEVEIQLDNEMEASSVGNRINDLSNKEDGLQIMVNGSSVVVNVQPILSDVMTITASLISVTQTSVSVSMSQSPKGSADGLSNSEVAGIIIACLLLVLVLMLMLAFFAFYFYRRLDSKSYTLEKLEMLSVKVETDKYSDKITTPTSSTD